MISFAAKNKNGDGGLSSARSSQLSGSDQGGDSPPHIDLMSGENGDDMFNVPNVMENNAEDEVQKEVKATLAAHMNKLNSEHMSVRETRDIN